MAVDTQNFKTVDLSGIPQGTIASKEVAKSGVQINTIPEGKYTCSIVHMVVEQNRPDDLYNPDRMVVKTRFRTETGKLVFVDLSWEPAPNPEGIDGMTRNYSQVEQAVGMFGAPVEEVLAAAAERTFLLDVNECGRAELGDFPEHIQDIFEAKGKGSLDRVTVYVKADDDDLRIDLASRNIKLRNYVKSISLA